VRLHKVSQDRGIAIGIVKRCDALATDGTHFGQSLRIGGQGRNHRIGKRLSCARWNDPAAMCV
jgi:hypothetical protein